MELVCTLPKCRWDKWRNPQWDTFDTQLYSLAKSQWKAICNPVTTGGDPDYISGFDNDAGNDRVSLINWDYAFMDIDFDSKSLDAAARGVIYHKGANGPEHPPCAFITDVHTLQEIGGTNPGRCSEFKGARDDRIVIFLVRAMFQDGEEVDGSDPVYGFRAITEPYNEHWGTWIQNLIIIAGAPGPGESRFPPLTPILGAINGDCDWDGRDSNRYVDDLDNIGAPNVLAHEVAHLTELYDTPSNYKAHRLLVSEGESNVVPRGFSIETGEGQTHRTIDDNCDDFIDAPFTYED